MPNTRKVEQVGNLSDLLNTYKHFFVVEYTRTPHKALEDLRKKLRASNATMKVLKNTLFEKTVEQLAEKEKSYGTIKEKGFPLKGSSAMVGLSDDWSAGLKAYYEHAKKDESLAFKFGFIDNQAYDAKNVEALAKLPSKAELMAKVIGGLKTPMIKTVFAMKFNMQRLVTVMTAKASQG